MKSRSRVSARKDKRIFKRTAMATDKRTSLVKLFNVVVLDYDTVFVFS